jgi:hypothetical protein
MCSSFYRCVPARNGISVDVSKNTAETIQYSCQLEILSYSVKVLPEGQAVLDRFNEKQ